VVRHPVVFLYGFITSVFIFAGVAAVAVVVDSSGDAAVVEVVVVFDLFGEGIE
jgi:hypothetical protein